MKQFILLSATIVLAFNNCPATAQNSSNCRVIYQSNGLAYPSSSYITPGTLSKTAQEGAGYTTPQSGNGLPKVNHGGYLGTPGDNLYSGNPDLSQPKIIYSRRASRMIYRQPAQPAPKVYTPDANVPMSYSDYKNDLSEPKEINNNSSAAENKSNLPLAH